MYSHANKCALSHLSLQPISSSPSEQSSFSSQCSAIGMHLSSRLQKNSGSGPLQGRLELPKEENAEEWLEALPPAATISEGMRAFTAVAASESNSSVRIMKTAHPSRSDAACPPAICPRSSPPWRGSQPRLEVRKLGGRETRTPSEMTSFSRPRFLGLCCLVVLKEDKLLKVCELEHAHRQTYQHVLCRKPQ